MSQSLMKCVNDEIRRNQSIIDSTKVDLPRELTGRLEKQTHGKNTYFYLAYKENGKRVRKCLGKANAAEVRSFVRDICKIERIKLLENNNQALEELKQNILEDSIPVINARLPETCRGLLMEGFVDERMEQLKAWARAEYRKNTFNEEKKTHVACDGTPVRSKGEVIWYNLLYSLGIPFRYEPLIELQDDVGRTVYKAPDFQIQCYDGSFILIEHLGCIKDPGYCNGFATKCRYYLREGYVLGVNYFVSSDDVYGNTDSFAIAKLAQLVEQRFYGIG